MGVEEYSRKRRYEFFNSVGADKIATAHNLSDSVETVLFRLSRGTGIKGVCGIPAVRDNIIRPLIECTSEEIRNACKESEIPFVVDETNSDNEYSRNYIRNVVVPEFKRLNPSFENAVERFASSANEAEDCLDLLANECLSDCLNYSGIDVNAIKRYHTAIAKRAIIKYAERCGITLDELHLNGVVELLNKSGKLQLKGNVFALSNKNVLRITELEENVEPAHFTFGTTIIEASELSNHNNLFYCDADKVVGNITVRERRQGDSISPSGRGVTKSLKKLFNELEIPVESRNKVPVICDENGVIGVYSYCVDERVRTDKGTKSVMLISISMED